MKAKQAESPFLGYLLYGPYLDRTKKRSPRFKHYLQHSTDRTTRTTMTVARYKMCVFLDRVLSSNETVDHIDENSLNDKFSNLQLISRAENARKNNRCKGRAWVELLCPTCELIFQKAKSHTHISKKGTYTACSRACSGAFGTRLRDEGMTSDVKSCLELNVLREFRLFST